jgi:hypothetical protein
MKVFIGSILVIILIGIGVWFMLSPTYKKVGGAAKKYNDYLKGEDKNGKRNKND